LERPEFQFVSPLAKDFLKKLLVKDPTGRLTVSQALNHIWISGCDERMEQSGGALAESLREFKYRHKWVVSLLSQFFSPRRALSPIPVSNLFQERRVFVQQKPSDELTELLEVSICIFIPN
jgi:serine/threonine protein kinase